MEKFIITRAELFAKIDDCYNRIEKGESIEISNIETTKGETLSGKVKFGFQPIPGSKIPILPVALVVRRQVRLIDIKSLQIGDVEYEIVDE